MSEPTEPVMLMPRPAAASNLQKFQATNRKLARLFVRYGPTMWSAFVFSIFVSASWKEAREAPDQSQDAVKSAGDLFLFSLMGCAVLIASPILISYHVVKTLPKIFVGSPDQFCEICLCILPANQISKSCQSCGPRIGITISEHRKLLRGKRENHQPEV